MLFSHKQPLIFLHFLAFPGLMIYIHQGKCLVYACKQKYTYIYVVQGYTQEHEISMSLTVSLPIPLTQRHSHVVHYIFSDLVPFVARSSYRHGLSERKRIQLRGKYAVGKNKEASNKQSKTNAAKIKVIMS